jgi:hypothetical protein
MAEKQSSFTTKPKKIASTGEFAWGGESGWADEIETSENISTQDGSIHPTVLPPTTVSHFDATQLNLTDGEEVTRWHDQVNGNDLSGSGPTYIAEGMNTNPVVRFERPGSDLLTAPIGTFQQPNTVIVVFSPDADTLSNGGVVTDSNDVGKAHGWRWAEGASEWDNFDENGVDDGGGVGVAGENYIMGIVWTQDTGTIRQNGTEIAQPTLTNGNALVDFVIGDDRNHPNDPFGGDYAEIIVYDSHLTTDEFVSEEQRLSDKWGIALS